MKTGMLRKFKSIFGISLKIAFGRNSAVTRINKVEIIVCKIRTE
jgi:hypothetical protein